MESLLRNSACRFGFSLTELEVFTNDDKQRTFLALKLGKGSKEVIFSLEVSQLVQNIAVISCKRRYHLLQVCTCIRRVNKAFLQHGLQVFYQVNTNTF